MHTACCVLSKSVQYVLLVYYVLPFCSACPTPTDCRSHSNPLSTVRFTSKAPFGFAGFSAPVTDLFPAVLTLFTLLGVENTDLRDQFTPAGWEPDRTPVGPRYSGSAFAKTRLNSKSFSYHSGVLKCFPKYRPA